MEFELLRVVVALVGCIVATYFDLFNKRNIPNWLTYSFVGIGVLVNLWPFSLASVVNVYIVALAVFVFGYLFYKTGQIGGADVLMFTGIALLLPEQPKAFLFQQQPQVLFSFPFIVSLFVSSGFLFMLAIVAWFAPKAAGALAEGKIKVKTENALYAATILVAYAGLVYVAGGFGFSPAYFVVVGVLIACSAFVVMFREFVMDSMIESVGLKDIEEEDVLAIEKMDEKTVKKFSLKKLLTIEEIEKLKKTKLKKFPVFKHMPVFLPFVLAGLVLNLLFGDFLAILTSLALSR